MHHGQHRDWLADAGHPLSKFFFVLWHLLSLVLHEVDQGVLVFLIPLLLSQLAQQRCLARVVREVERDPAPVPLRCRRGQGGFDRPWRRGIAPLHELSRLLRGQHVWGTRRGRPGPSPARRGCLHPHHRRRRRLRCGGDLAVCRGGVYYRLHDCGVQALEGRHRIPKRFRCVLGLSPRGRGSQFSLACRLPSCGRSPALVGRSLALRRSFFSAWPSFLCCR